MTALKTIRILAVLSILCALCFGVYTNFSQNGSKSTVGRTVMVCVYK